MKEINNTTMLYCYKNVDLTNRCHIYDDDPIEIHNHCNGPEGNGIHKSCEINCECAKRIPIKNSGYRI